MLVGVALDRVLDMAVLLVSRPGTVRNLVGNRTVADAKAGLMRRCQKRQVRGGSTDPSTRPSPRRKRLGPILAMIREEQLRRGPQRRSGPRRRDQRDARLFKVG
jgi:hypothetical protein